MARTRTLTLLIADVRSRADMVNSVFVTDAEITEWLNQGIAELDDLLVDAGNPYYLTTAAGTTVAGTDSYALASDFYKLRAVDVKSSGSQDWENARRFNFEQRNDYPQSGWNWPSEVFYDVRGVNLVFLPMPDGAYSYRYYYYRSSPRLVAGGDTVDGVNGWEELAITHAVIRALTKEESDASMQMAEKAQLLNRILHRSQSRDVGEAPRVRRVRTRIGQYPFAPRFRT